MSNAFVQPMMAVELAKELIAFPSVTPEDCGVQAFLANILRSNGFSCLALPPGDPTGKRPIQNLVAFHGTGHPRFAFNGHTDVVEGGTVEEWISGNPFTPFVHEGFLYGRGAEDMKGGVAAAVAAAINFVRRNPHHAGTICILLTGDEETEGTYGTPWIVEWLRSQELLPDACVIPEPASHGGLGRTIRIGSRGCYEAKVTVRGEQGHSAYAEKARNPIHAIAPLLEFFRSVRLDGGTEHYQPTSVQVVSVKSGYMEKYNIIPGDLEFNLNVRYTDLHDTESLHDWLTEACRRTGLPVVISKSESWNEPYLTTPGPFTAQVQASITRVLGVQSELSTIGGASDARVLSSICPTVEVGPENGTLHKVNERVSLQSLMQLQQVFEDVLANYLP